MYNPLLNTFLAVADCGSFTKAADHLYISSTAVMKQINALEQHLELKLVDRTPARRGGDLSGCKIHDRLFQKIHPCRQCRRAAL